jgi:hypothetical protein
MTEPLQLSRKTICEIVAAALNLAEAAALGEPLTEAEVEMRGMIESMWPRIALSQRLEILRRLQDYGLCSETQLDAELARSACEWLFFNRPRK